MRSHGSVLDCFQHAQEAEALAAATADPFLKEQWHQIARGYAELARKRLVVIQAENGTPPASRL